MDFGFDGKGDNNTSKSDTPKINTDSTPITNLETGTNDNGESTDLDEQGKPKVKTVDSSTFDNGDTSISNDDDNKDKSKDKSLETSDSELVEGTVLEIGENKYTVDATGNVVDKDGNIFKEAKDVKDWMASLNIDDSSNIELSITAIQEKIGVEIVDEEDKPIVFDNTPEGINSYIEAVLEVKEDDIRQDTVANLYKQIPILPDVINYYVANGNSLDGFNEVQDRSNITIDDTNIAQQESIIRTAWTEQGRKGDVEGYIAYLKSSGTLLPVSKEELQGLQDNDKEYKEQLAEQAKEVEAARIEKLEKYWKGVHDVIKSKNIAGYEIPDTIIINKNGKKTSATPTDFYNYIYQTDNDGKSAYQKEQDQENIEDRRNDQLLRAYLKFVGGNYSNLVQMAVNKDKVRVLKLQAANKTTNSIKITKPKTDAAKGVNTDFGY